MRYLFDTCVLIWIMEDRHDRLSPKALELISLTGQQFAVSIISLLEISLKASAGKMKFPGGDIDAMLVRCSREFIEVLSLDTDNIRELSTLPLLHSDPFDRLLAAVSITPSTNPFTVISPNKSFDAYASFGVRRVW